jgi:hypothetical protein
MNLDKAINSAGGLILGIGLIVLSIFVYVIAKFISQRKNQQSTNPKVKKVTKITSVVGGVITVIFAIYMVATGSTQGVGTLFSTMRSSTQVIQNNTLYVKTDLTYNGENNKYTLGDATNAITGVSDLQSLKGYSQFDIFVAMDSNISGSIFVKESDKSKFEDFYTDYTNNYDVGATFDKQDSKMTTVNKDVTNEFYSTLANAKTAKVDEGVISYSSKISSTKCCIFWATSKDKLVSHQIRVYPKDQNGNYVQALADDDDMIYYELPSDLNSQLDEYFK